MLLSIQLKRKFDEFISDNVFIVFGTLIFVPLLIVAMYGFANESKKEKLRKELYELCNEDVRDPAIVEKYETYDLEHTVTVVLCTTGEKRWVRRKAF